MHLATINLPFMSIDFSIPHEITDMNELPDFCLRLKNDDVLGTNIKNYDLWMRFTNNNETQQAFNVSIDNQLHKTMRGMIKAHVSYIVQTRAIPIPFVRTYSMTEPWSDGMTDALMNAAAKVIDDQTEFETTFKANNNGVRFKKLKINMGNCVWLETIEPSDFGDYPPIDDHRAFSGSAILFGTKTSYIVYRAPSFAKDITMPFKEHVSYPWIHNQISDALCRYRLVDPTIGTLEEMYSHRLRAAETTPVFSDLYGSSVLRRRVADAYMDLRDKIAKSDPTKEEIDVLENQMAASINCLEEDMHLMLTGDLSEPLLVSTIVSFHKKYGTPRESTDVPDDRYQQFS